MVFFLISRPCSFCIAHRDWFGILANDHFLQFLDTLWDHILAPVKTSKTEVFMVFLVAKPMRF